MVDHVTITVNGRQVAVRRGTTVAVAVVLADVPCRHSATGQPRAPFCGSGVCQECRVTVNGEAHVKSCQLVCEDGMEVVTDA